MKEGKKKAGTNSPADFQASAPSHPRADDSGPATSLPGGEALPGHCLAGVPIYHSDRLHHPCTGTSQSPRAASPQAGRGLGFQDLHRHRLTNWCRRGKGSLAWLGWILQGSATSLRPVSKGGGHLRQACVLKEPYQGEGPPSRALDSEPGPGVRCGPQFPTLGAPSTTAHRPQTETDLPPDRRGPGTRAGARAASCPPSPYLRGPRRTR